MDQAKCRKVRPAPQGAVLVLAAVIASAGLSGCASSAAQGGGSVGAFASAASGVGSPPGAAAIAEAMGGGLIGGDIGNGLRQEDRRSALEAEYRALEYTPVGQRVNWQSADRRHAGEVVAAAPYRVGSQDCRQYVHTVQTAGGTQSARGTACRNADGSWTLLI